MVTMLILTIVIYGKTLLKNGSWFLLHNNWTSIASCMDIYSLIYIYNRNNITETVGDLLLMESLSTTKLAPLL